MTSLRGHHLICLHFFGGEGYGASFVENLENVIKGAKREGIKIQQGADDVCIACPHLAGGMCDYGKNSEKEIEALDATALKLLNLQAGAKVDWEATKSMLPQIFPEWRGKYCFKCDWLDTFESTGLCKSLG